MDSPTAFVGKLAGLAKIRMQAGTGVDSTTVAPNVGGRKTCAVRKGVGEAFLLLASEFPLFYTDEAGRTQERDKDQDLRILRYGGLSVCASAEDGRISRRSVIMSTSLG